MNAEVKQLRPADLSEAAARAADEADPLSQYRGRFHLPQGAGSVPRAYFCGNSLGLQPVDAQRYVTQELEDWRRLAVDAHFHGRTPWFSYHEVFRDPSARLIGALPEEVVAMNGLTVNLHLMMVSFYRPRPDRYKILMEENAFPSDVYAVGSQLAFHGHDPHSGVVVARGGADGRGPDDDAICELIDRRATELAMVLLGGVNYYSGRFFDLGRITATARRHGIAVGLDLAHAVGNVPLQLHDWGPDFAVWCSYKYLNGGPGAVAGCFVHRRHAGSAKLPRLAGWWGNDPATRFRMHLERDFVPRDGADGWQLSNPPVLALAPLRASLDLFDEVGMEALRERSVRLTGYLQSWVENAGGAAVAITTPRDPERRGCQLSLRAGARAPRLFEALAAAGIVGDLRQPDTLRIAPAPLYNSFHDIWRFGRALQAWTTVANGD